MTTIQPAQLETDAIKHPEKPKPKEVIYNELINCKRQGYIQVELKLCEDCKHKCMQYYNLKKMIYRCDNY